MTQSALSAESVYSTLGTDPDLGELVDMFVDEMPDRIATLIDAFQTGDHDILRRTAHQLKGSLGSYGFDQLTSFAAELETAVADDTTEDQIRESLDALVSLCKKLRAGAPE